jgi:hypothetical protein
MVTKLTAVKPLLIFCGGYSKYIFKKTIKSMYFCSNFDNACDFSLLICANTMNFQGTTIMFCFGPQSFMKTSCYYDAQ